MLADSLNTILEAGSDLVKPPYYWMKNYIKTLLDISSLCFRIREDIANKFGVKNINFVEGNIFSMPFKIIISIFVLEYWRNRTLWIRRYKIDH